jgi:hypothetical protein
MKVADKIVINSVLEGLSIKTQLHVSKEYVPKQTVKITRVPKQANQNL